MPFFTKDVERMHHIAYVIERDPQFLCGPRQTVWQVTKVSMLSKFWTTKSSIGGLTTGKLCARFIFFLILECPLTPSKHVSSGQHIIGIQFLEKSWEQLRAIPVDREGEFVYTLRPRTHKYPDRLLCEVTVVDNTKVITIRSTFKIENLTLYPLELMLLDDRGQPTYPLQKVVPGNDFHVPIDVVTTSKIRIQPDRSYSKILTDLRIIHFFCRRLWLQMVSPYSMGRPRVKEELHVEMSSWRPEGGRFQVASLGSDWSRRKPVAVRV